MALRVGGILRSRGRWLGGVAASSRARVEADAARYRVALGARPQTFEQIFREAVERFDAKQVE